MIKRLKKKDQQAAMQDIVQHLLVDEGRGGAGRRSSNAIRNLTTNNGRYQLVMKPGSRQQVKKLFDGLNKSRQENEANSEEMKKDTDAVSACFEGIISLLELEASDIMDPNNIISARVRGSFSLGNSTSELNERKRILALVEKNKHKLEESRVLPDGTKHICYNHKTMLLYEVKYYHASLEFRNILFHRRQTEGLSKEVQRVSRYILEQEDDKKKFKSLSARLFDSDQELSHVRRSLFYGELCDHMENYLKSRLMVLESHGRDLFLLLENSDDDDGLLEVPIHDAIDNKRLQISKLDIIMEKLDKIMRITSDDRKHIKFDEFSQLQKTSRIWWAIMKTELKQMCENELKEVALQMDKSKKELKTIRCKLDIVDKQQSQGSSTNTDNDPNETTWDQWREPWKALERKELVRYNEMKERKEELENIVQEDYEEVINDPSTPKEVLSAIQLYVRNPERCTDLIAFMLKKMFIK